MLYHRNVFVPSRVQEQLPTGEFELQFSRHCQEEANDRYGVINLPKKLNTRYALPFEFEVNEKGDLTKIVYKMHYNERYYLILVVVPHEWFVKTCWLNCKTDNHRTLDKSRYSRR